MNKGNRFGIGHQDRSCISKISEDPGNTHGHITRVQSSPGTYQETR